jgi:phospholipid/cholesterol/gamma-HCH transport system ATP-binding protein
METVVAVKEVVTRFGENLVHDGVSLEVKKGEIFGLLGPSGCGKTTLMREMLMLETYVSGSIHVLGEDVGRLGYQASQRLREQWGVLFQQGALFSSLTVAENIGLVLKEYAGLSQKLIDEIVAFKIALVGLKPGDGTLYPSQISGGMRKKAALARALAIDPKLLFLDEPTSGLDPISAREFDDLILQLRDMLGLSIIMVSHDLRSIYGTLDRMVVIDHQKIVAEGSLESILNVRNDFIETFFRGSHE